MRTALLAALLAGCSCEEPRLVAVPAPETTVVAPSEAPLPSASRTDLPASTATLTITVRDESFLVSNRALVATWPDAERDAVGQTRPLGDAEYPVVERDVDDASDALVVPGLRDALTAVVSVDRARATIVHAEGTATSFAIRAGADVHYARVLAAVFAAGMAGFNQPRLVLASGSGDRDLSLTMPDVRDEAPDPQLGALLAGALAGGDVDTGPPAAPGRTHVTLTSEGLTIRRGALRLAPGCTEPAAADATTPTIATTSLSATTIDACLAAAPGDVVFTGPGTMRYGDVVAILEALAAHHAVSLSAAID